MLIAAQGCDGHEQTGTERMVIVAKLRIIQQTVDTCWTKPFRWFGEWVKPVLTA